MRAKGVLFRCKDCSANYYPSFMVRNILWSIAVGARDKGIHLCLSCFRERLGRTIHIEDFKMCPLNKYNMSDILEFLKGKDNII